MFQSVTFVHSYGRRAELELQREEQRRAESEQQTRIEQRVWGHFFARSVA